MVEYFDLICRQALLKVQDNKTSCYAAVRSVNRNRKLEILGKEKQGR